jgi:MoaA/NifB/PqqE/SkfB family radical SAM enzyme
VSWLGGEPLQWTPVWELARTFRADLGLRVSVTTNGTALASPAVRARLIADFAEVTVSVDGLEPFHDAIRGWRGGWTALARGVRALADETRRAGGGPRLRANVVVMRDNVGQLEPLADALAGWGVEELTINQLGGNDRPEFHRAHRLTPADADRHGWLPGGLPCSGDRGTCGASRPRRGASTCPWTTAVPASASCSSTRRCAWRRAASPLRTTGFPRAT